MQSYNEICKIAEEMDSKGLPIIRIAIFGNSASKLFEPALKSFLLINGFSPKFYFGNFNSTIQEFLNRDSKLITFKPQIVVINNNLLLLNRKNFIFANKREFNTFVKQETKKIISLWNSINERITCSIIQSNFEVDTWREFGNYENKLFSFKEAIIRLNLEISSVARTYKNVFINDVDFLSSYFGRKNWTDYRIWHYSKSYPSLDFTAHIAKNICDIILAVKGKTKKCVVFDLDNFVWGGIVAEDGIEKIAIGGTAFGEAFTRIQQYLKNLKQRGIILAVCSKNSFENAIKVFREHPDMILRENDISFFAINWQDKATNIKKIAKELNIEIDSMVFFDDDPVERELVESCCWGICVPDLPEDPVEYITFLQELNLFESASFTEEDVRRTEYYKVNTLRNEHKSKFKDLGEFLDSLTMVCNIHYNEDFYAPRAVQLFQRCNQFNLTGERFSETELKDNNLKMFTVFDLNDKFGDSGSISAMVLQQKNDALVILNWVMSCRVFSRDIEKFVINWVIKQAIRLKKKFVIGKYNKTQKNEIVRDLYGKLGFSRKSSTKNNSVWVLNVSNFKPLKVHVCESNEK